MSTKRKLRREDYALQVVPEEFRTWHWVSLLGVMSSAATAMVFLALGGKMVKVYGAVDVMIGLAIGAFGIGTVGFILAMIASDVGLDMDLITSGSGFGYKGAGITSLIYAGSLIVFFAMEASIIALYNNTNTNTPGDRVDIYVQFKKGGTFLFTTNNILPGGSINLTQNYYNLLEDKTTYTINVTTCGAGCTSQPTGNPSWNSCPPFTYDSSKNQTININYTARNGLVCKFS